MEEQLELDFTSECPEEARELGIRWAPRNATPVSYTHLTLPTICSV